MSSVQPARPVGRIGIGEVLKRLRGDFPDVTISKIRFLEAEGLVEPDRTASGYRKFSASDLERLRYVLAAQRDHYLPLKVIREHLDAMARGLQPPVSAGESPRAPTPVDDAGPTSSPTTPMPDLRMSRAELVANSGLTEDQLTQLEEFGLVRPRAGTGDYDQTALTIAGTAARMCEHGLEPRHLRIFKSAADREVGLVDQVVAPVARQRDPDAAARATALRADLASESTALHHALVRLALDSRR